MKLLFFTTLLSVTSICYSQGELPSKDGRVIYEYIDSSVNASALELFSRAKLWFANSFKDSKSVIQLDDKENHSIVGKGNFQFVHTLENYVVKFTVKFDSKDNKYRIQFYDITVEIGTRKDDTAETWNSKKGGDKVKAKINNNFQNLITSIRVDMIKKNDADF